MKSTEGREERSRELEEKETELEQKALTPPPVAPLYYVVQVGIDVDCSVVCMSGFRG